MLLPKKKLPSDQQSLLTLYQDLEPEARSSLIAFAEFLVQRQTTQKENVEALPLEPRQIPRPDNETVIGAIKRLSETYFMLDRDALFSETSALMSTHIMQGREAAEVIEELEALGYIGGDPE